MFIFHDPSSRMTKLSCTIKHFQIDEKETFCQLSLSYNKLLWGKRLQFCAISIAVDRFGKHNEYVTLLSCHGDLHDIINSML